MMRSCSAQAGRSAADTTAPNSASQGPSSHGSLRTIMTLTNFVASLARARHRSLFASRTAGASPRTNVDRPLLEPASRPLPARLCPFHERAARSRGSNCARSPSVAASLMTSSGSSLAASLRSTCEHGQPTRSGLTAEAGITAGMRRSCAQRVLSSKAAPSAAAHGSACPNGEAALADTKSDGGPHHLKPRTGTAWSAVQATNRRGLFAVLLRSKSGCKCVVGRMPPGRWSVHLQRQHRRNKRQRQPLPHP